MKRPHIPLSVKVAVAERQAVALLPLFTWNLYTRVKHRLSLSARLAILMEDLFNGQEAQLDHDPALSLRTFNPRNGRYRPDANDPDHLVYRLKTEHLQKTTGRKPGAQRTVTSKGSDVWLAKKYRKQEKQSGSKRYSRKIPSRPFAKGRSSFAKRAGKGS